MTKSSAVFCKKHLAHMSGWRKKLFRVLKFIFGPLGGAFFSDLCHFSGFADFSRFADFGCLKHITKANHLLSSHSGNEGKTDALRINPHFLKNFSPSLSA